MGGAERCNKGGGIGFRWTALKARGGGGVIKRKGVVILQERVQGRNMHLFDAVNVFVN